MSEKPIGETKSPYFRVKTALLVCAVFLLGVIPAAYGADDPNQVTFTLEGCNLTHGATFDEATILCSDDGYTTGNLGDEWAELDLVPHRVTLKNGDGLQSYRFVVGGDQVRTDQEPAIGWDYISQLILNPGLSTGVCEELPAMGALTTHQPGGFGGADFLISRTVDMTDQLPDTECVYDYFQRLAVGGNLYSGASLQSNLYNQYYNSSNIGKRRIQLKIAEVFQDVYKDMSATQDSSFVWNIIKGSSPASVSFGDTCDPEADFSIPLGITVEWEKLPGEAEAINVVTNIYATNPAHRQLQISYEDALYDGLVQLGLPISGGPITIPAGETVLLATHQFTVADGATDLNDIVIGTYLDPIVDPLLIAEGFNLEDYRFSLEGTASAAVQPGTVNDATATITDVEEISGTGLTFSVDSTLNTAGSFDGGYILGSAIVGPLTWTSDAAQTAGGFVTFNKTIYLAEPMITSGILGDIADLDGSDGFHASTFANIGITSTATVDLIIDKTMPDILQGDETVTFDFAYCQVPAIDAVACDGEPDGYATVAFAAGETNDFTTVSGLAPGFYLVEEVLLAGFTPQSNPQVVEIALPSCAETVYFVNDLDKAQAFAKKVTNPSGYGYEAGWQFQLYGPGDVLLETIETADANAIAFDTELEEGSYYIAEVEMDGWVNSSSSGCEFTVDYPADFGAEFLCEMTNDYPPTIEFTKVGDDLSKIGDLVDYTFTLENTSLGDINSPPLYCEITDTLLGLAITTAPLLPGDIFEQTELDFMIPESASDPFINTANVDCYFDEALSDYAADGTDNHSVDLFQPAIAVAKTGDALSKVGDTVDYTITLSNNSSADTPDMVCDADDPLLGGNIFTGVLPFGDTVINLSRVVQEGDPDPLVNTVTLTCSPDGFPNVLEETDDHSTDLFQPSIEFSKTGDAKSKVGDDTGYTITLNNTSSVDTPDLVCTITDTMLGIDKQVTLASGANDVTTATYTVPEGAPDPLVNTANVTCSPDGFDNTYTDEDSWTTELFQPSIELSKTGDAKSKVGDDTGYTITLNNTSSADTPDLVCTITDTMLGIDKQVTLASGANDVTTATYTVPDGAPDPLVNTADVTCSPDGFDNIYTDEQSWTTELFQPSIELAKTGDAKSKVGDDTGYTITLNNTSSVDTPDLVCTITDTMLGISKDVTLASGANDVTTATYTVQPTDSDPLVNTAAVTCSPDGFDNTYTDEDSWTTELFQPSIEFTKTGDAYSKPTDDANYTITLNNTSSADTPDLECTITDIMLDINKQVTLASGANDVTTASYTVPEGAPDPLVNTAGVSCSPIGFPNVLTLTDTHSTDLFHPSFILTKDCADEPVDLDGPASFDVVFTNDGDVDLVVVANEDLYLGSVLLIGGVPFNVLSGETLNLTAGFSGPFANVASVDNTVSVTVTLPEWTGLANTYTAEASASCRVGSEIELLKKFNGAVNPSMDFTFKVFNGPNDGDGSAFFGSEIAAQSTLNVSDGVLAFGGYTFDPNAAYTVCEMGAPSGWSSSWMIGTVALAAYNPHTYDSVPEDIGVRCVDFGAGSDYPLTAGSVLAISVNNTVPQGDARTPGYWKNWNHCSNGNQAATAEKNGGVEAGFYLLEDALGGGIAWGDFIIDDCATGVAVLDARDNETGKKMSKDAAYRLARALLATQLNFAAGAETCQNIYDIAAEAQALLESIGFDGNGRSKGLKGSAASGANELAGILDDYNNNLSCGVSASPLGTSSAKAASSDGEGEGEGEDGGGCFIGTLKLTD